MSKGPMSDCNEIVIGIVHDGIGYKFLFLSFEMTAHYFRVDKKTIYKVLIKALGVNLEYPINFDLCYYFLFLKTKIPLETRHFDDIRNMMNIKLV